MIDFEEMKYTLNEAEFQFLLESNYYNWQTYFLKVNNYYNIMASDARYIEVKDLVKTLLASVRFLFSNIPKEYYRPCYLELESLSRIEYFLENSLKPIKIPKKKHISN